MMMAIVYFLFLSGAVLVVPFVSVKWKGIITVSSVIISAIFFAIPAVRALTGDAIEFVFQGSLVAGPVLLKIDALSGWFILLINFTMVTGALYGLQYMKGYYVQSSNLSLHCIAFLLVQTNLGIICIVHNAIAFLFAWETMAVSVVLLVIFEHVKHNTIKAGLNYLIQSHLCVVFLSIGFLWVASRTNSFDFDAISQFSSNAPLLSTFALFLCFFTGFAFKAGFVPFHTWLPYAHPAAPSHISGIMSGVIIKIGIYGILRMILLIHSDYTVLGLFILFVSVFSALYGVMLAILQHNLKKLLAYHSIENIGIIGIGIGLGCIGIGKSNNLLATAGFAGALLHVLNHSLFKSLLFYVAGNVYRATHSMNIESLGGLTKKLPQSSFLFLAAALAICGLPPFNGFVSEFLIYYGLFSGFSTSSILVIICFLFSIFGLALIGGLALLCFTKAFGVVFLGTQRNQLSVLPFSGAGLEKFELLPMYLAMGFILAIGLFPSVFLHLLSGPVKLFSGKLTSANPSLYPMNDLGIALKYIGLCGLGFVILSCMVFFLRKKISGQRSPVVSSTWGCGYVGDTSKMEYSASSFIRSYRKLAGPLLSIRKEKKEIEGIFPKYGKHETYPYDKLEGWLIDQPLKQTRFFFGKFRFLQNGMIQLYTLYGVIFIILVIVIPPGYVLFNAIIEFLNQL